MDMPIIGSLNWATSSAFPVANPGADHAILATVLVARLQRCVLRRAKPRRVGITVRTARLVTVDGKSCAALLRSHHLIARSIRTLRARCGFRRGDGRIVVGVAVSRARPDRERPCSV